MRHFTDSDGRGWEVVIGRESFGALYALFVPRAGNESGIRQAPLRAESRMDAATELEGLEPDALDALFGRSKPKGMG